MKTSRVSILRIDWVALAAPAPVTAPSAKTAPPLQPVEPKNNHRRHLIYLLIGAAGVVLGLLAGKFL